MDGAGTTTAVSTTHDRNDDDRRIQTHAFLSKCASEVKMSVTRSVLKNNVSSHWMDAAVSLRSLREFVSTVTHSATLHTSRFYAGALDGTVVVSAHIGHNTVGADDPPPRNNKRRRDDVHEQCERRSKDIVDKTRTQATKQLSDAQTAEGQPGMDAIEASLSRAEGVLTKLLHRTHAEQSVETCGLHLSTMPHRPPVVLMCRFAAGIATPVRDLWHALGAEPIDGLITTDANNIHASYRIPQNLHSEDATHAGRKGLLMFVAM